MKNFVFVLILTIYTLSSCMFCTAVFAENKTSTSDSQKADSDAKVKEEKEKPYSPHGKYLLSVDMGSDLVMYEKNADQSVEPSGFTKIVTAITALELADDISKTVAVENGILEDFDYNNQNIGLKYGEIISIADMIKAMLIYDAGDCAIALAHSIGKSYDEFVEAMNETSKKAGAENSVFVHPAGFEAKGQKTTLTDMYYITKYALKNETFADIVNTERIEIAPTNKYEQSRILFNTNQFISTYYSLDHYNANVYGVKSYTANADDCGVIAHYNDAKNNLLLLCAQSDTANGNNYAYNDVEYMISHAKETYTQVTVVEKEKFMSEVSISNGKNTNRLLLVSEERITTMLPKEYDTQLLKVETSTKEKVNAPIQKGDVIGKVTVYYDGKKCGETNLLAYSDVEKSTAVFLKNVLLQILTSIYFKLGIVLLILIFILRMIQINRKK